MVVLVLRATVAGLDLMAKAAHDVGWYLNCAAEYLDEVADRADPAALDGFAWFDDGYFEPDTRIAVPPADSPGIVARIEQDGDGQS